MAYELHIERLSPDDASDSIPIQIEEWKLALSQTENVRLCAAGSHSVTNPTTREVIGIPLREGDAEVYFPADKLWRPVFRWRDGAAHTNARFEPGDKSQPVWVAMAALAAKLNAAVRGDDGEIYDLRTGDVTS